MCILIKFSAVAFSLSLSLSLSPLLALSVCAPISCRLVACFSSHSRFKRRSQNIKYTHCNCSPHPLTLPFPPSCCHKSLELPQNQGGLPGLGGVVIMCNCAKCFSNVQNVGQKMKRNFSCSSSKDKQGKTREGGGGSNQR